MVILHRNGNFRILEKVCVPTLEVVISDQVAKPLKFRLLHKPLEIRG